MAFNFTPPPRPEALDIMGTGGQGTRGLLTGTLSEARRRARLTGRSLSAAETEGITSGYFGQASTRLGQRKALALNERGQDITMRGQDINVGLGRENLLTAERMHEQGLSSQKALQQSQIASTELMEQGRIDLGKMEVTAGILSSLLSGGNYVPDAPIDVGLWLKDPGLIPVPAGTNTGTMPAPAPPEIITGTIPGRVPIPIPATIPGPLHETGNQAFYNWAMQSDMTAEKMREYAETHGYTPAQLANIFNKFSPTQVSPQEAAAHMGLTDPYAHIGRWASQG